jgi:hypothetical protein
MTEDKSFVLEYYIPDHPSVKKDKKAEKEAAVAWLDNKLSEFEQQKKYDEWYLKWLDGFKDRKDLDKISKEMIREQLEYVKRRNELMRKLNDHRP